MLYPVDIELLSRELVRQMRGTRTQKSLSQALGFGSNVLYLWESGRRSPETSRFFRLCELVGRLPDVSSFLARSTSKRTRLSTPRGVHDVLLGLTRGQVKSHLAERLEVDRTTLARWLEGQTEPRLPEFLRLVDITTQRLLPFVQLLSDPAELSATRAVFRDLEAQRRLAYELPWSHAVLRALELDDYQNAPCHRDEILARRLGLSVQLVRRSLDALADAGQIQWTGRHWALSRVLTVDTRTDKERDRRLKEHWSSVGTSRIRTSSPERDALFSYNLFAVSAQHLDRIRQLHLEYYDAVRALVEESPSADRVVLMNLQLIPLDEAE